MKIEYKIRDISLDDVSRVTELEHEIFPSPWSKEVIERIISKNPAVKALAADMNGTVVAYAFYWILENEMRIANLAVEKQYRRRNIAGDLLEKMISDGVRSGAAYVCLEVRISNIPAISLYEKYGFYRVSVNKNYYSDNSEDALIMVKPLKE